MNNNEIWLTDVEVSQLLADKLETVKRKCRRGDFTYKKEQKGHLVQYYILLSSLPLKIQKKYNGITSFKEENVIEYNDAPLWAKKQADKYLELIKTTDNLKKKDVLKVLEIWNEKYPDSKVSYPSLMEAKRKYEFGGVSALLSKKGKHRKGISVIDDVYFEYFKSLYLREGAPSANSSWKITFGYAKTLSDIKISEFPCCASFLRKLRENTPEQAIYLARYGKAAWNKKYANFIERDYSNIQAGEFWVSDHAQIDVAVSFNGKVYFPWVTVFRDIKTSKWLGWFLHTDSPNSDHIFQAFYYGVQNFGLPSDVYLDNGKDYRCKDFAGGRTSIKVNHSADRESSLLNNINVNVHFALPYNAQTKPVERDFLKIKTYLSKFFVGYRGGKITERPEKLLDEIKSNSIMDFEDFKTQFDYFIENILNKMPSKGKVLKGKTPDELWDEEFKTKKVISRDALKLFCLRTTKNISIGRNGVHDSQLDITYWDEWMITEKGKKVFIRRDVKAYQEAWIFDAETEKYLGKGFAVQAVPFMACSNIEKEQFKKAIENKKRERKIINSYLNTVYNPSNEEIISNLENSLPKVELTNKPKVTRIANTKMDKIAQEIKGDSKKYLKYEKYTTPLQPKKKLYLTEAEKRRDLEEQEAI